MSDEKLQQQIADIGTRYLKRTVGELEQLRDCLVKVRQGEHEAMKTLAQLGHRIHGSGAMFGFELLSERAHEIERLAASGNVEADTLLRLQTSISALEDELNTQVRSRSIE